MHSLVVPLYNESEILNQLHAEVSAALNAISDRFEVIYVDDGSSDGSLGRLIEIAVCDPRVVVVQLSRNWGHQAALTAGLSVAQGDSVIFMDGDLQDPPAVIPAMLEKWRAGAKVVIAQRVRRNETGLRRLLMNGFYRLFAQLSDFPIPLNAGIFGLLDRQACDALRGLSETNRYLPGLRAWVGFKTAIVFYERAARVGGEPKQSLLRLFRYALDAVFSFSYKPLRLSLFLGGVTALVCLLGALAILYSRIARIGYFGEPVVAGYASTIIAILFIGSVQLFCVGILGEYIGRIYDEVKARPLFIIEKLHRHERD